MSKRLCVSTNAKTIPNDTDPLRCCCTECGKGEECTSAACVACSACLPGFYKAFVGVDACVPCPANTFRTARGATELAACVPCHPAASTEGRAGQSRRDACVCDVDHYAEAGVQEPVCVVCPRAALCEADGVCLLRERTGGAQEGQMSLIHISEPTRPRLI
eukprot:3925422-Rhodomonas_salina.2